MHITEAMITTDIIEAHLAGTVLPRWSSKTDTGGTPKVMSSGDKTPYDKQRTLPNTKLLSTIAAASTSSEGDHFDLSMYLTHLEAQKKQLDAFAQHKQSQL